MSKKTYTLMLCSILLVSTMSVWIKPCSANPIAVSQLDDGAAFHNGTFIHMPFADVEINITRTSNTVMVDLYGIYKFETNQTQNTTLAYAYPSLALVSLPNASMTILIDSVETNFTIRTLEQLQDAFDLSDQIRHYTSIFADLAFFEVNLVANRTMTLQVFSKTNFTLGSEAYFYYNYIFGSARTFEGDTREKIHIHLVQETPFIGTSFSPEENLDVVQNGIVTDATWEFNVSSLEANRITFSGQVNLLSPSLADIVFSVVILAIVVIILVPIIRRRRS